MTLELFSTQLTHLLLNNFGLCVFVCVQMFLQGILSVSFILTLITIMVLDHGNGFCLRYRLRNLMDLLYVPFQSFLLSEGLITILTLDKMGLLVGIKIPLVCELQIAFETRVFIFASIILSFLLWWSFQTLTQMSWLY